MGKIYEYVYGLSCVGSLDQAAQVLASVLDLSFEGRTSDWLGDYYLSRNAEQTEQLRLFDDSGEESHLKEDYGEEYSLFLEISVESELRAREIGEKLVEARAQFHQAFLQSQKEYQEGFVKRKREERERVRDMLSRGEDPYPLPTPFPDYYLKSGAFSSLPEEKQQERLRRKQKWLAKNEARLQQLQDSGYQQELLARLDREIAYHESQPFRSAEPKIVLLKGNGD